MDYKLSRSKPSEIGQFQVKPAEFLNYNKRVLEAFFSTDWFSKAVDVTHDAYVHWIVCNELIMQNGHIHYPQQAWMLPILARVGMDNFLLAQLTDGDTNRLVIGALKYGNRKVRNKILTRFPDSNQFQDMLVELEIGAWHLMNRDNVTPLETLGFPDIKIDLAGCSDVMYIECKNLRSKDERRIFDVVSKANAQLEKTKSDSYGCLVLKVAQTTNTGATTEKPTPSEVLQVEKVIESLLSGGQNQAIGSAIIIWDGFEIIGSPPANVSICYSRKSIRVNHANPNKVIPSTVKLFEAFTSFQKILFKSLAR